MFADDGVDPIGSLVQIFECRILGFAGDPRGVQQSERVGLPFSGGIERSRDPLTLPKSWSVTPQRLALRCAEGPRDRLDHPAPCVSIGR